MRRSSRQLAFWPAPAPAPRRARALPAPPPEPAPTADEAARRAARELAGDLVLRAGAGTGKTHTLVEATVHLIAGVTRLHRRVPPGRILLVTFSDKARGELGARVATRLAELAERPREDAALERAYARTGATPLAAEDWRAAAGALAAAPITTFHGFAAGLLRRHAAEAGLDPGFALLDEAETTALLRQRAEEAVLAALDAGRESVRALVRELDYSRDLDGRGVGLVEHVVELARRLREEGRPAGQLAGLCDDSARAAAAFAGARQAFQDALAELIATLSGRRVSAGVATRRIELERLAPVSAILSVEADPTAGPFLREIARLSKGSLGNDARRAAQLRLREAEAALLEAHAAFRAAPLERALLGLVADTIEGHQRAKAALGALDFADLLPRARAVLAAEPAARTDEQARLDAVLVDELQDTNELQDELLGLVRGPDAPLLVVGDPKQSIYAFRGADVAVFDRVAARVAAAGGRALALTESRRGRAPLVAFINRLFARAMRGGAHAFEVAFEGSRDALQARRPGDGPCVEILGGPGGEAARVARRIQELCACGAARPGEIAVLLRRFTHLDAFLGELRRARVPHHVVNGRGFHEAQEVRDLVHALALVDDPDDALAWLGVLRSPLVGLSDASLVTLAPLGARLLEASPAGLPDLVSESSRPVPAGDATLEASAWAPGQGPGQRSEASIHDRPGARPAERANEAREEAARLAAFSALLRRLRAHADRLGAGAILRALVEESDLAAVLATTFYGEQRVANLERLVALAEAHDREGRTDRLGFARRLRAEAARERSLAPAAQVVGEADDVVRIMTVHQAKGLEFPVVFVPECGAIEREPGGAVVYDRQAGLGLRLQLADGERVATPQARAAAELRRARARAESLRIFYVATTRARDLLILSGEAQRGESWRRWVDDLLAEDAEARAEVRLVEAAERNGRPETGNRQPATGNVPESGDGLELSNFRLPVAGLRSPVSSLARVLILTADELLAFAACPHCYHLDHELGLGPRPAAPPASDTLAVDAPPVRLLIKGRLDGLPTLDRLRELARALAEARRSGDYPRTCA